MTFVSTLGQALDQVERLKVLQVQMNTLQTQLATGKKTNLFKGLETEVVASKRARANFNALDTYINNINIADRRIKITLNALEEAQVQSKNMLSALEIQTQQGEYEIAAVGQLAGNLQDFIGTLLNQQDGDRYVFGGSSTLQPPVIDSGSLDTYTKKQITDWVNGSISTDQLMTNYRDRTILNDTIVGYNAEITSGSVKNVSVRVDDASEIDYTVLANEDPLRNILVGISLMKSIDDVIDEVTLDDGDPITTVTAPGATQQEKNDNFYRIFNDVAAMMNRALDQIDDERFKLSQAQAQISQIADNHKIEKNVLLGTIADIEDVDINEVAVKINGLSVQLEASYRVSALASNLSLVNFL